MEIHFMWNSKFYSNFHTLKKKEGNIKFKQWMLLKFPEILLRRKKIV